LLKVLMTQVKLWMGSLKGVGDQRAYLLTPVSSTQSTKPEDRGPEIEPAEKNKKNNVTSKERMYAVLHGLPYDRPAVTPIFMAWRPILQLFVP